MLQKSAFFFWEIETVDGEVYFQDSGIKWQDIDSDTVLRASILPSIKNLQRIDIFCHKDNKFVGWFGKGFIKQANGFKLSNYLHCIETEHQRVWVFDTGRVIITHRKFNLRI